MKRLEESSISKLSKYIIDSGRNKLSQYEKRKELRDAGKHDDPGMGKASDNIRKRRRGLDMAARAIHRKIDNYHMKEDAPVNNVGGGGIAGVGVGPNGEPGVPVKAQRKHSKNKSTPTPIIMKMLTRRAPVLVEDTFAGAMVFEVSSAVFHTAKMEKRKGKHWRKYLEEDDCLSEIREYANKNPGRPIILKNKNTGEMTYARYGKRR